MPHVMTYKEERRGLEKKRGRWPDLVILRGPMHVYSSQKVYKMNPSLSRPGTLLRWPWETVNKSHTQAKSEIIHAWGMPTSSMIRLTQVAFLVEGNRQGAYPVGNQGAYPEEGNLEACWRVRSFVEMRISHYMYVNTFSHMCTHPAGIPGKPGGIPAGGNPGGGGLA